MKTDVIQVSGFAGALRSSEPDRWHLRSSSAVAACGIGNILGVTTVINGTFSAFLLPVSSDLHWSRSGFSFGLTILSIVGVICYPLAGRLMDRLGRRPVALIGNLLFGASIMLLSLLPRQASIVYLMFVLVGATATLPSTVLFGRVASAWFERQRGLALGLSGGVAFGIGGFIIPTVAQLLIDHHGWRQAYAWLGAIVMIVGFPAFWLLLREPKLALLADGAVAVPLVVDDHLTPALALREPSFWVLFVSVALGAGSIAAIATHMAPIVVGSGMAPLIGATALSALFLTNAVWQIGIGLMLDRSVNPKRAAPFVLAAVGGALLLAFASSPPSIILGALLIGFGCGTEYGLLPFCIPRYFGLRFYGEIYGWIFGAIMLIQGLAPFLMDVSYDATGSYRPSLIAVAFTLALCGVLILRLPTYRFGLRKT